MKTLLFNVLCALIAACPSAYCQTGPVFVQGVAFLDTTFAVTTVSATFPANPAPGNAIVVGCMGDGGSSELAASGVTDNQSNTYTQVVFQNYTGSGQPTALYVATNIISVGAFVVTCGGVEQVDAINLFALEYSGLAKTDVVDAVSQGDPKAGTYPRACGTVTTTAANDLIVALFNNDGSSNPARIVPVSGYAVFSCEGGDDSTCAAQNGSKNQLGALIGATAPAPGAYTPAFASGPTGPNSQSICVVAAFKAASK